MYNYNLIKFLLKSAQDKGYYISYILLVTPSFTGQHNLEPKFTRLLIICIRNQCGCCCVFEQNTRRNYLLWWYSSMPAESRLNSHFIWSRVFGPNMQVIFIHHVVGFETKLEVVSTFVYKQNHAAWKNYEITSDTGLNNKKKSFTNEYCAHMVPI